MPPGPRVSDARHVWGPKETVWFKAVEEDRWVNDKFGILPEAQTTEGSLGRIIFCNMYLWSLRYAEPLKQEEAAATDLQATKSREEKIACAMPPAMACVQERWEVREVPRLEEEDWSSDAYMDE